MTKDESKIQDWRSTGRRRARKELFKSHISFECADCGKTTKEPPKDAPRWFEEIWPETLRVLAKLEANHTTKDVTVNDVAFLEWLCPSCHKKKDSQTGVGESTVTESYW